MISQIITTFGLVLDIIGAFILFFFALPQPSFEEGVSLGLEDNTLLMNGKTVAQYNDEIQMQTEKYRRISRLALALIILGFFFQLIGTWVEL